MKSCVSLSVWLLGYLPGVWHHGRNSGDGEVAVRQGGVEKTFLKS